MAPSSRCCSAAFARSSRFRGTGPSAGTKVSLDVYQNMCSTKNHIQRKKMQNLRVLSHQSDVVDIYQREFLALRDRLHAAEQESLKRSKELNVVLDEIKRAISEKQALRDINRTWSSLSDETKLKLWNITNKNVLHLPTIFHHLPHLLSKENSLQPAIHLGQGRTGVSIVMGIPSVKREVHSYLTDTLNSLISELNPQEKEDSVIVVMIAETDPQYTTGVAENIKSLFPNEIHSGLLEVISPSPHFYPDFSRLRESFGDPKERVRWRTKQNLDYCFLMMYAQSKGIYYVQLEDDIVAKPNYLSTMKNFALQQPSEEWMILEFSQLGFIGKMFKSLDLSLIVEFILMFYKDKPIDWLLDHILWVKVCNPEKDAKHCDRQKANLRIRFKPSLFQHVGTHSSLAGKIQKLKDKDFGKQSLRKEHVNPPAEVSTSLKTYQHFSLEKAYLREDFFWAFTPTAGDFIRFRFFKPLRIERAKIRSGLHMETKELMLVKYLCLGHTHERGRDGGLNGRGDRQIRLSLIQPLCLPLPGSQEQRRAGCLEAPALPLQ
ncbi:alpha-1,3-mannosyl-glycoprotein 4-beta-N-acetylglucosaminyltransferase B isoform X3 [Erythrolamprus reginae]|uniref:alpha-1,3-mannosyl-glycoprotein 4-beta-N-acetylglucosaminyltransferase B isoform X3 n=1 Tax=Erythrolamprus reginae TaxID=121349 RepID=UPI00396CABA3